MRLKLFTLDNRLIVRTIGRLAQGDRTRVGKAVAAFLFPDVVE